MLNWLLKRGQGASAAVQELAGLDRAARAAEGDSRAGLLNRCGDLCAASGRTSDALGYYGEAVDSYLNAGFVAQAAAMCRKILRLSPASVRPHCTLACLAAHQDELDEARHRIDRYVDAARRSQTQRLAIARLRLVQEAVLDPDLRRHIAVRLAEMGDLLGAERIEHALRGEPEGAERSRGAWERLVLAAAADPDELWRFA